MVTIVIHILNLKVAGLWSGFIIMQKIIMVSKFLSGLRKSRGGLNMSWFFPLQLGGCFFLLFKEWFQWNKLEQN